MAASAIKQRGWLKWAVLGLIVLGGIIEFIQAFVGRDASLLDALTNGAGVLAGAVVARLILHTLRMLWDFDMKTPSP